MLYYTITQIAFEENTLKNAKIPIFRFLRLQVVKISHCPQNKGQNYLLTLEQMHGIFSVVTVLCASVKTIAVPKSIT